MLTSQWNQQTAQLARLTKIGDPTQQTSKESVIRPTTNDSSKSIDNAFSLEHLFTALRRRIRRIVQVYNPTSLYNALKICARVFRSYASYNLNTIDGFARRLYKNPKDNKKLLNVIDQFRLQLAELRHCHSTFQAELLVTTLAIDFHEDELDQQQQTVVLPAAVGKFSPRSRISKFRLQHARQAADFKSQLKQTNENLQILLFDEFSANLSHLWDESDKFISSSMPFHDHHMTYILRLIPDIALKFEYALQICGKLFDLESTMSEIYPQNSTTKPSRTNPTELMTIDTPRSDFNRSHHDVFEPISYQKLPLKPQMSLQEGASVSDALTSASSTFSAKQISNSPISFARPPAEPADLIDYHEENPIFPSLFSSSERFVDTKNDQSKLQLLTVQLEKRLNDEEIYYSSLMKCVEQRSKKSDEVQRQAKEGKMFALVMSNEPAVTEYQRALCLSDLQVYQNVDEEIQIAIRETEHRIAWLRTVLKRARQCLAN